MKVIIYTIIVMAMVAAASADVYVNGYYKSNGTYVAPHIRSNPDAYQWNNYGSGYNGGLR